MAWERGYDGCSMLSIDLTPISLTSGLGMRLNTDLGHVWLYPLVDTISICTVFCSILGTFSIIVSAIAKKQVLSHKVRNC